MKIKDTQVCIFSHICLTEIKSCKGLSWDLWDLWDFTIEIPLEALAHE